jgi:hypothetical protein
MTTPHAAEVYAVLRLLCTQYPQTFRPEADPPLPLAIGIKTTLAADLAEQVDPVLLGHALRVYTRRAAYRTALRTAGAMRVDLTGACVEPVALAHQQVATRSVTGTRPEVLTETAVRTLCTAIGPGPYGDARMKLTLIGRPTTIVPRGTYVSFRLTGTPPPALPRGLPSLEQTSPLSWTVLVGQPQWRKVEASFQEHADDRLILEGYPVLRGQTPVLLVQSCTTVMMQQARKEAQRSAATSDVT